MKKERDDQIGETKRNDQNNLNGQIRHRNEVYSVTDTCNVTETVPPEKSRLRKVATSDDGSMMIRDETKAHERRSVRNKRTSG
jgi:hypothetical protein